MESLSRSWSLFKYSWAVLMKHKTMLLFPLASGLAVTLAAVVFIFPALLLLGIFGSDNESGGSVVGIVLTFLFGLVTYTVSLYFSTALIGSALGIMDGEEPTFQTGLAIANSRLSKIVQFAAISATVGTVTSILRERGGLLGSLLSSGVDMAWGLATFLVIPILIVEDITPWEAVKRSTAMLKQTWGEQLSVGFGLGAITAAIMFLIIIGGVVLMALVQNAAFIGILIVLMVVAMIGLGVISSALNGVFRAIVYRYVQTGAVPDDMDIAMLQGAFKAKRKNSF